MKPREPAIVAEHAGAGWRAASYTHRGSRIANEDTVAMTVAGARACFLLADGLGGHSGGAQASRIAVETALRIWREQPTLAPRVLLTVAIEGAHAAVRVAQREQAQFAEMRTTLVMLVIDPRGVAWAHVGDTRLYHFAAGRLEYQTKDHSVPQFLVTNGELEPAGVRNHPDRSRLLGTLGNEEDVVYPSVRELGRPPAAGDAFLLCSDGFWEDVIEPDMERALGTNAAPRAWLESLAAVVEDADRPDRDNCTACAVWIDQANTPA